MQTMGGFDALTLGNEHSLSIGLAVGPLQLLQNQGFYMLHPISL